MYYVYLLQYDNQDKHYIGCTNNLRKRIRQHQQGTGGKTTRSVPDPELWRPIYYEAYLKKSDALRRERKLKQYGSARGHLYNRVEDSLQSRDE